MGRENAKVRLGRIAGRQWGRVSAAQIQRLGVDDKVVADWKRQGYLHRVLPRVYAVGHRAASYEADLVSALLYAGPGAALSHATAAHWLGLLDKPPRIIHVSTPRRCRSVRGITVHGRRDPDRFFHRRLPLISLPQLFLDLAATEPRRRLRVALANADYKKLLNARAAADAAGRGRPGSARLREALSEHLPSLARTKSDLEIAFLELCESAGIPLPETNVRVAGWEVDALFRAQRIAVELDGIGNHRTPAQIRRDRRKELALRKAGFQPVRYSGEQLDQRVDVLADLHRLGAA